LLAKYDMHHDVRILDQRTEQALRGETIYGDDFSAEEIEEWFRDEENGYASLDYSDSQTDYYAYYILDQLYFWRFLKKEKLAVLGMGSAFGSEFMPITHKIDSLSIIEPSEKFWKNEINSIKATYTKPNISGKINFPDNSFDLITSFGVLHHIPNISYVLSELVRTLRPNGHIMIREPIVSMGDWRNPRPGLTLHERGIPLNLMERLITHNNLDIISCNIIGFGPLLKLASKLKTSGHWNNKYFVQTDNVFSKLFLNNYSYHRTSFVSRFAPTMGCWVLSKN